MSIDDSDPAELAATDNSLSLDQLVKIQRDFDKAQFSGPNDSCGKRRHVFLHLAILTGKLARAEEREDHDEGNFTEVIEEALPDLLVYAAQLAEIFDVDLSDLYRKRLDQVALRNAHHIVEQN